MIGDKQRAYVENEQDLKAQSATVESLTTAVAGADKQLSAVTGVDPLRRTPDL